MTPSSDRLKLVSSNLLAHPVTGREDGGENWKFQPDHTQNFSEFENAAPKQTKSVF